MLYRPQYLNRKVAITSTNGSNKAYFTHQKIVDTGWKHKELLRTKTKTGRRMFFRK
ncbi:MAG TPA: hypothetical protein K8V00_07550 [Ligilactobacillus acidipiscis]|uniref:Uncharacterized protein n=1 Tax=Ligilactobacillus acidipiscis TaxID=89059 RepID=A0A921K194_9LACO|nr:hypothetical protein [Ligilactobacillus acidipiscis]